MYIKKKKRLSNALTMIRGDEQIIDRSNSRFDQVLTNKRNYSFNSLIFENVSAARISRICMLSAFIVSKISAIIETDRQVNLIGSERVPSLLT